MVPKFSHTTQTGDPYKDHLLLTTQVIYTKNTLCLQRWFSRSQKLFLVAVCHYPTTYCDITTLFYYVSLLLLIFHVKLTFLYLKKKNPGICGFISFQIHSLLSISTANASDQIPIISHLDYCLQSCLPQSHPPHSWQSDLFKTKIWPCHSS